MIDLTMNNTSGIKEITFQLKDGVIKLTYDDCVVLFDLLSKIMPKQEVKPDYPPLNPVPFSPHPIFYEYPNISPETIVVR